jgi:hypothetical protein
MSATDTTTAVRGDDSNDATRNATRNATSDVSSNAGTTSYASAADLASVLRRASSAHGAHERRIGHADPNWPDWYAAYMVAEHAGVELPA